MAGEAKGQPSRLNGEQAQRGNHESSRIRIPGFPLIANGDRPRKWKFPRGLQTVEVKGRGGVELSIVPPEALSIVDPALFVMCLPSLD